MTQRGVLWLRSRVHKAALVIGMVSLLLGAGPFYAHTAYGAQITSRSLTMSSNKPGEPNVDYDFTFSAGTSGPVGSIEFQLCSNSALIEDTCTPPTGLDASGASLVSQTGTSGFILSPTSTANDLILTQIPDGNLSGPATFTFDHVVNPTDEGSYYAKIFTYASNNASGTPIDFGALAFTTNRGFDVSAEVPPYLTFCSGVTIDNFDCSTAQGRQLNFGEFSSATSSVGQSQILVATNAGSGYNISVSGITMTSGNNVIPAVLNQPSQIGVSQFGINTRSNTVPDIGLDPIGPGSGTTTPLYSQQNRFRFNSNERIATATNVQDFKKYTISYLVNVAQGQAPGVYSTTLTYVCVANF